MNSLLFVFFLASIGVQGGTPSARNPPTSLSATAVSSIRELEKVTTVSAYCQIAGATAKPGPVPTPTSTQTRTSPPRRGGPVAPSNLAAFAISTDQISLTWRINSNNHTGFIVERALLAAGPWKQVATIHTNATSWGNAGLRELTTYYFRIIAYNSAGSSPYSNIASATTQSRLPTGAPSKLAATAQSSSQINLTWSDNSSDETGFKIERCQGKGCSSFAEIATVTANATSYEDMGLSHSMSYSYQVRANKSTVNSAYSNTVTATTARDTAPPAIPAQLTATAVSSGKINLRWNPEVRSGGVAVAGYTVYQAGARIANTPKTSYSVTGLAANVLYCYTVTAYDKEGNRSDHSTPACATTKPDSTTNPDLSEKPN